MRARQPVQPERYPNDWVGATEAAEMLRISVATFLRKVEEGLLPSPSTVLGNRNPRWNVKSLYDAMAGIVSEQPVSDDDVSDRIAGLTQ
jgi:hypothetical protein